MQNCWMTYNLFIRKDFAVVEPAFEVFKKFSNAKSWCGWEGKVGISEFIYSPIHQTPRSLRSTRPHL